MSESNSPFGSGYCTMDINDDGVVVFGGGDPVDFRLSIDREESFGSPSYDGYAPTRVKVGLRYITIQPPRGATTAPTNSVVPLRVEKRNGAMITVPLYKASVPQSR